MADMTIARVLDRAGAEIAQRAARSFQNVDAIYDDELWKILAHFGLLEPLDRGELVCYLTGVQLTRDNVGGLIGTPDGPKVIADTYYAGNPARPETP
ncbi:MAG: hypothetical protein M3O61_03645 [Gemmatimonadota bacterium]|nr:hypothetical protein [Gemmatimonadota bacterium]